MVRIGVDNNMKKIMLDCNAFDDLVFYIDLLISKLDSYEYYIINVVEGELNKISDIAKRDRLLEMMNLLNIKFSYTSPAIYGTVKYGMAKYGGDKTAYERILKKTKSNIKDALIGSSAVKENCIVITNDGEFQRKMKNNGYQVLSTKDFIEQLR